MSHTCDRAHRLEALRLRALRRNARRAKAWCSLADTARINPWSGRYPKGTAERIAHAERLTHQSQHAYALLALEAYTAERKAA
jgi:hypothetical protein